ncbi:host-nuclease inhibitor Gam family protein [Virgibacillus pantothenticus]|uniref:host-nuclease inhibitor Gam family protein n=1 Tax=Virgibacillus pantothenticus TaxID=1473 RepID=UPI0009556631|nr:host-nuclease inhibitor Gam family protein [Virgibacillus pantothenticus]MED3737236.1 host-nuclease inhibitor Gam family protein [Virgibacillus pantothenticus]QTY15521.1 host-nuclease inhibitor Gam family protein [Virgibacillus pantothenticus]SIT00436.1 Bacteriophage Mu Gam like protein [Virgibacillus pantothenticus]
MNEFADKFIEQQEQQPFVIDDDSKADWALRKIKLAQAKKEELSNFVQVEMEKLEAYQAQEQKKLDDEIDRMQGYLSAYALQKRENDPEFKSQNLPNGRLRFVKQQPKYHYDDKVLIESLKKAERSDLIKIKETPDKATLKKVFVPNDGKLIDPDTGEVVEGVTIEEREEAFKVEVNK